MSDDRPPTDLLVGAQIRTAAREGIPITVRKRGNDNAGAIILKVDRLDGTAHVYSQVRLGDELVWCPLSKTDPMPEADAEKLIAKQAQYDPDCWLVDIEDKTGRHWFPGRITKL